MTGIFKIVKIWNQISLSLDGIIKRAAHPVFVQNCFDRAPGLLPFSLLVYSFSSYIRNQWNCCNVQTWLNRAAFCSRVLTASAQLRLHDVDEWRRAAAETSWRTSCDADCWWTKWARSQWSLSRPSTCPWCRRFLLQRYSRSENYCKGLNRVVTGSGFTPTFGFNPNPEKHRPFWPAVGSSVIIHSSLVFSTII
jgi:hypothetical protein